MEMVKFKLKRFIWVLIIYILLTFCLFYYLYDEYFKINELNKTIPFCIEINEVKIYRGTLYINDSFFIHVAVNNQYEIPMIEDFINIGDSICVRGNGNDTIFVYRNGDEYFFID